MKDRKDRYAFIAIFDVAEDGISITFPDLPGCLPCADNMDEAFKNAQEALGLHLYGMEQDNENIPTPTNIQDIHLDTNQLPAVIEVFMPSFRDKIANRFVKKTLSLPAWLADMADKDGVNCSKLFQSALIDYLGVSQ